MEPAANSPADSPISSTSEPPGCYYEVHDVELEAVVVNITKDYMILVEESTDPYQENYFWMNSTSKNTTDTTQFPRMREYVVVREVVNVSDTETPSFFIKTFEYAPKPDRVYKKQEVFAVAKVMPSFLVLVGMSVETDVWACVPFDTDSFSVGQLVIGDLVELPLFVDVFKPNPLNDEIIHYKMNFDSKFNSVKNFPKPIFYPENVRPLSSDEEEKVFTRCANVPILELQEAQRFIQEPLIAAGLLEKYLHNQEAMRARISTHEVKLGINELGTPFLSFSLDAGSYYKTQSLVTWRVGGELQVSCRKLGEKEAYMIIRGAVKKNKQHTIDLVSTGRSLNLLRAAFGYKNSFKGEVFYISPSLDKRDVIIEAMENNFDDFFLKRRNLFDQCIGRVEKHADVEVENRDEPFLVNGKPLDDSQLDFMRSAASIPGFTCAQAPPGCGKTHTISALIAYLNQMEVEGGICISGTTNAAVTNAADAVASRFPEIRITREYSLKAEGDVTIASQKASLKKMAEEAEKYVDLETNWHLRNKIEKVKDARDELYETAPNLKKQLSKVQTVETLEMNMKQCFVEAYDIHVYATTVELLIRRGDIFRGRFDEEDRSVRRIILDEAAQMSPLDAMALYCSFPHLEYITLLGDMKQLGPYTIMPPESMSFKLMSEGELTRMFKLPSTTKKELNTIYRCHPTITQKFLLPIYGSQMNSGVTAASRSLVMDKDLLKAQDGSPCVLIDVEGKEDDGKNHKEKEMAIKLVTEIVDVKGVPAEDVVVICYHRAQLNALIQELKDQGTFGPLCTKVAVHTVDSFQGKEAKVIILLTTKICKPDDDPTWKMKFVGDAARGTVAVSRAQHALYILGHWESLAKTKFWSRYLDSNRVVSGYSLNLKEPETFGDTMEVKQSYVNGDTVNVMKTDTPGDTVDVKQLDSNGEYVNLMKPDAPGDSVDVKEPDAPGDAADEKISKIYDHFLGWRERASEVAVYYQSEEAQEEPIPMSANYHVQVAYTGQEASGDIVEIRQSEANGEPISLTAPDVLGVTVDVKEADAPEVTVDQKISKIYDQFLGWRERASEVAVYYQPEEAQGEPIPMSAEPETSGNPVDVKQSDANEESVGCVDSVVSGGPVDIKEPVVPGDAIGEKISKIYDEYLGWRGCGAEDAAYYQPKELHGQPIPMSANQQIQAAYTESGTSCDAADVKQSDADRESESLKELDSSGSTVAVKESDSTGDLIDEKIWKIYDDFLGWRERAFANAVYYQREEIVHPVYIEHVQTKKKKRNRRKTNVIQEQTFDSDSDGSIILSTSPGLL